MVKVLMGNAIKDNQHLKYGGTPYLHSEVRWMNIKRYTREKEGNHSWKRKEDASNFSDMGVTSQINAFALG